MAEESEDMRGPDNAAGLPIAYLAPPRPEGAEVATAPPAPLQHRGGPVLTQVEVVPIYWGTLSSAEIGGVRDYLVGLTSFMSGGDAPAGREPVTRPYGVLGASLGRPLHVGSPPQTATLADAVQLITTAQGQGHLEPFARNRLFLVLTKGIDFTDPPGYGQYWCGFHTLLGPGQYVALVPYPTGGCAAGGDLGQVWQIFISHEVMEAATDPAWPSGWLAEDGDEGGDLCEGGQSWGCAASPLEFGVVQCFGDNKSGTCNVWSSAPDGQWITLGEDIGTVAITAGQDLYRLRLDGSIWKYVGPPMTGWAQIDANVVTRAISGAWKELYKIHADGSVWWYTPARTPTWTQIDLPSPWRALLATASFVYKVRGDGSIWRYVGPDQTWEMIDQNPAVVEIAGNGSGQLYKLHADGSIWAFTGLVSSGWTQLDFNPTCIAIAASGDRVFQLLRDGNIWRYVGLPDLGWDQVDGNPTTRGIAAAGGSLFKTHDDGSIWSYIGPPMTGWTQLDANPLTRSLAVGADRVYQLRGDGSILVRFEPW
jgi:hypothetical protein